MTSVAITLAHQYEFVDSDMLGVGKCIRRAGQAGPGMLSDTPSLCGKVLVGTRYTRSDAPEFGARYKPEFVATRLGTLPTYCKDCLHVWREETGQVAANDSFINDLRDEALEEQRNELAALRKNCARYEARVMELDARAEGIRLLTRGEWCKAKEWVEAQCAKMEGK